MRRWWMLPLLAFLFLGCASRARVNVDPTTCRVRELKECAVDGSGNIRCNVAVMSCQSYSAAKK